MRVFAYPKYRNRNRPRSFACAVRRAPMGRIEVRLKKCPFAFTLFGQTKIFVSRFHRD